MELSNKIKKGIVDVVGLRYDGTGGQARGERVSKFADVAEMLEMV